MFRIYEGGLPSFAGTLERLYEVHPVVPPIAPARDPRTRSERDTDRPPGLPGPTPSAIDAYRNAARLSSREPILHAHQVMRTPVVTMRPEADVREAWLALRRHGIGQMPVQSADQTLVGLISERDLLGTLIIERDRIREGDPRAVETLMLREVVTAEPVTDLRRIARVMADRQLTAMPIVTEHDELVGIVSRGDLLRAMTGTPPLRLWT